MTQTDVKSDRPRDPVIARIIENRKRSPDGYFSINGMARPFEDLPRLLEEMEADAKATREAKAKAKLDPTEVYQRWNGAHDRGIVAGDTRDADRPEEKPPAQSRKPDPKAAPDPDAILDPVAIYAKWNGVKRRR